MAHDPPPGAAAALGWGLRGNTCDGGDMSLLRRLFGKKTPTKPRVRVCVECGMPVAEHKEWCSILRGQREMQLAAAAKAPQQAS